MGELTASLAHEITQPISSARNNARAGLNFLDKQLPELSEVREALNCVVGDADRAGSIVDRIRDQVRKAPPRKLHFDLNESIDEVLMLARSAITMNGVSVQMRLADGLLPVYGDRVLTATSHLELDPECDRSNELGSRGPTRAVDQHRATPSEGYTRSNTRFGAGYRSGKSRARFRAILHHQVQRGGNGAIDLSVHYRCSRRPAVGGRQ